MLKWIAVIGNGRPLWLAYVAIAFVLTGQIAAAGSQKPWEQYILAPSSRTVRPTSLYQKTGSVSLESNGAYILKGPNSSITFDFGQQTGGYLTVQYGQRTSQTSTAGLPSALCEGACQALGLGYSESTAYVAFASDYTSGFNLGDGVVYLPLQRSDFAVPTKWGRGGFRYLTLSLGSTTDANTVAEIKGVSVHFTPEPNVPDDQLRSYTGYFHCSDDLLNRVWYAGVYTAQMVTIGSNSSVNESYPAGSLGWDQDLHPDYLGPNDVFLADGAKRDRSPFSGDLVISLKTLAVARDFDNLAAAKGTLITLIKSQDPASNYFPYAGSPILNVLAKLPGNSTLIPFGSDTYHLYTILGFCQYVLLTSDLGFATAQWPAIYKGIQAVYPFINSTNGLFNSTRPEDWARPNQGGLSSSVNAIFYGTLNALVRVSKLLPNEPADRAKWTEMAARVKQSANSLLWDPDANLFAENTTSSGFALHPLDGNSFALVYNLTSTPARARMISTALRSRWVYPYGAPTPELPGTISPFISSFELQGHFLAAPNDSSDALALIRLQWGYMLQAFSNSTFVEGYTTNGSLNYGFAYSRPPYVSHTHGWSTGPTGSLMEFVAGLRATPLSVGVAAPREQNNSSAGGGGGDDGGDAAGNVGWIFQPHIMGSGLSSAQGGHTVPNVGAFSVSWTLVGQRGLQMEVSTPPAAGSGTVFVPLFGHSPDSVKLTFDDTPIKRFSTELGFAKLTDVKSGSHKVKLTY